MGETTGISWTDHTLNPIIGCQRVSPGCEHCYAESQATARMGRLGADGENFVWGPGGDRYETKKWRKDIVKWNREAGKEGKRKNVFIASMADIFESHPAWVKPRADLFAMAPDLDWLNLLLLTKRPENIMHMIPPQWLDRPLENVWYGTTGENQEWYVKRWKYLSLVPAYVRFVSWEPALGLIDVKDSRLREILPLPNWIIGGCESNGPTRLSDRRAPLDWFRQVGEQCKELGIRYFVKQLGIDGQLVKDVGSFPPDLRVQEFPR